AERAGIVHRHLQGHVASMTAWNLFCLVVFNYDVCIFVDFPAVMEVTQPVFTVVKSQGAANFQCGFTNTEDASKLRITLLKQEGNESVQICALSFPLEEGSLFKTNEDGIQCQIRPGRESVNITLWGLKATDAGLYVCQMEWIYPPPYYSVLGSGTQLFLLEGISAGVFFCLITFHSPALNIVTSKGPSRQALKPRSVSVLLEACK
uniref:Cytotoxic T-lymphocyte protein 4 n=1 Tax=Anolis carolinensis TaxID=28377 RepID=A0A803THU3_ANOCA